jgi:predicted DNA-binding transcriptional regulator AlpA
LDLQSAITEKVEMQVKEHPEPLATDAEFCEFVGITKAAAAQLRYMGRGPKFVKITGRQVRYRWSDIHQWVEEQTRMRT